MFYSLNRLVQDIHIIVTGSTKGEDFPSIGTLEKKRRDALLRVIVQLSATLVVIGICAFVINKPQVSMGFIRLAYIVLGMVAGYWAR